MTTVARLSADLVANSTSFESSLKRANSAMQQSKSQWNSALAQSSRSFDNFSGHVKRSMDSVIDLRAQLGSIATITASALSVQKIVQYSDMWKQMSSRLGLVTDDLRDLALTQESLFQIAQKNSQPVRDTADAYVRMANSVSEAQKQQYDLLKITDLLSKTLKISGTNAAGSATFLQQFGQAVSSDFKAIGQELQTFADQNPTFYKIIRDEAAKTGVTLKQFAADGGLSFDWVANALMRASGQIEADAGKIQLTVNQALTQLDNAFLKFVGQSDLVSSGTSSLAAGISLLAQNFGYLAQAATAVALVFGANLARALVLNITQWTVATARAAAFNYQLGVLAFGSRAASVAMVSLAGATSLLSGAIAFLGGPLGVALLGTLALMSQHTNAAADAQQNLNIRVAEHRAAAMEFISASADRRKAIEDDTRANIENYKRELEALEQIATALDNENGLFRFSRKIGSKLGIDTSAEDVRKVKGEVQTAISELEKSLEQFDKVKSGALGGGGGTSTGKGSKKDVYKDILDNLKKESELLAVQTKMYGQKESAISRAQEQVKIQNQLTQANIKLTKEQQAQIDLYLDQIEKQTELQNTQTEQQKKLQEAERDREQAMNQLGSTFESAFEKAISDGEKLSDVLDSLLDDILRILTRVTITAPIGNAITDIFTKGSSGGSGGGIFGDLFSFLPSFDVGTNFVPQDMVAQIHKGEMIVPAYDAAKMRGGAGEVTVNVNNNNGSRVTQTVTESADGTEIGIMIDEAVAEAIGRKGSKTNQALGAFSSRSNIRR